MVFREVYRYKFKKRRYKFKTTATIRLLSPKKKKKKGNADFDLVSLTECFDTKLNSSLMCIRRRYFLS